MYNINKPTIVLLHGWGSNARSWQYIAKRLQQNGYSSLSVQFPGFDLPQPLEPWGVPEYANFVLAELEDLQLKPPYILVGHSFGGRLSIYIASTRPELVDRLILTDAAGVENRHTPKLMLVNIFSKMYRIGDGILGVKFLSRAVRKVVWKYTASPDYSNASPMMREILKKVVDLNLESHLQKISAKTFILWGDKDNVTPLRDAKILKRGIKNSELTLIGGAGHNAHITHAQEWLTSVLSFLSS